jgi:hypothetical protein
LAIEPARSERGAPARAVENASGAALETAGYEQPVVVPQTMHL